jgi:hypothetical protein
MTIENRSCVVYIFYRLMIQSKQQAGRDIGHHKSCTDVPPANCRYIRGKDFSTASTLIGTCEICFRTRQAYFDVMVQ